MAKGVVDIQGDFSQMAEFLGSAEGWSSAVDSPYYIVDLLRAAHGHATLAFDKETAIVAMSTRDTNRSISHMYEWGTAGINEGDVRLSPNRREARLWIHKLGGAGANRSIDFIFKPSIANVPLPEGDWDDLQSPKKRYTFKARPWITEFGVPVVIRPKAGSSGLFIPITDGVSTSSFAGDKQRREVDGFAFTPYAVTIPGSKNAGNFSMHWAGWWNTEGSAIIDTTAREIVSGDMAATIKTGRGKGRALRSYTGGVASKAFSLEISNAKSQAYAQMKKLEDKGYRARDTQADLESNIGSMNGGP